MGRGGVSTFGDEDRPAHPAAQRTAHGDAELSPDGPGHAVPDAGRAGLAEFPGDQGDAARRGPDADVPAGRVGKPKPRRSGYTGEPSGVVTPESGSPSSRRG